jgi:Family of unknown function (DUF6454)
MLKAATTVTALAMALGGAAQAAQSDLAGRFTSLQRSAKWEQRRALPVGFPTHHPQGFAAVGDALVVSSVEIIEPTQRFGEPQGGYDRTPGKGAGHLFKMDRNGKLLAQATLGEGDVYHPGGIDYDGRWLWVPVGEYRPNSASILYRVDPLTLTATEVMRVKDHIGGLVHDPLAGTLHGVSWGSRRLYTWKVDAEGRPSEPDKPLEASRTLNPSHYVDYQDCALAGRGRALCSGVTEYRPDPAKPKWALGGIDLVDLAAGRPLHQVPILLWTEGGEAMTRNPVLVEPTEDGLRALFMPDDDRSTLYTYETVIE